MLGDIIAWLLAPLPCSLPPLLPPLNPPFSPPLPQKYDHLKKGGKIGGEPFRLAPKGETKTIFVKALGKGVSSPSFAQVGPPSFAKHGLKPVKKP